MMKLLCWLLVCDSFYALAYMKWQVVLPVLLSCASLAITILAHCCSSCSYHTYRQEYWVYFLTSLGVLYFVRATKQGTHKSHVYRLGNCQTWTTKISWGLRRWLQSHTSKKDVCWLYFTVWEQRNLNPPVLQDWWPHFNLGMTVSVLIKPSRTISCVGWFINFRCCADFRS